MQIQWIFLNPLQKNKTFITLHWKWDSLMQGRTTGILEQSTAAQSLSCLLLISSLPEPENLVFSTRVLWLLTLGKDQEADKQPLVMHVGK